MLLASLATFLTLKLSFYTGVPIAGVEAMPNVYPSANIILLILTCSLGSLLLVDIFLYKNRSLQLKICIVAAFIECIDIFLLIAQTNKLQNGTFSLWAALHLLILLFIIKASMGIYKDEKLIRDSNRLR